MDIQLILFLLSNKNIQKKEVEHLITSKPNFYTNMIKLSFVPNNMTSIKLQAIKNILLIYPVAVLDKR